MMLDDLPGLRALLADVVREAGRTLLDVVEAKQVTVFDTGVLCGQEESTVEAYARGAFETAFSKAFPHFRGIKLYKGIPWSIEHASLNALKEAGASKADGPPMIAVINALVGTASLKLAAASPFHYTPHSGVSVALCAAQHLGSVVVSAFYSMEYDRVYSAMKTERGFMAFEDDRWLDPRKVIPTKGDSAQRIFVDGYCNSCRDMKAELEMALWQYGIKTYEGIRASQGDLVEILINQSAAIIDLRALWPGEFIDGVPSQAALQIFDCAGMLPVMDGTGFRIADALKRSWRDYSYDENVPLIVARPHIYDNIMVVVQELVAKWLRDGRIPKQILPQGFNRQ